jgi:hypothetical protein
LFSPTSFAARIDWPLAQEYFKEDVGVASRVHISYFRGNIGLPFIATLHIRQIAWRVLNDDAPDRRAAKRPDEFEPVTVAAVLLESSVKLILRALAHAPIHLPERELISTYRWNKLSARLALGHRTPEGR